MKNKGFSLVEMLITIVILSIIILSMTRIQYFMSKHTVRIKEKTFATQKVIQMMEELRSFVSGSEKKQIDVLDDYDDGSKFNPILSTDRNIIDASASPSNNIQVGKGWKYFRKITVLRIPEEPFTRKVYIRIYKTSITNPLAPIETLAETVSVLKTIATEYTSIQVVDLYIIAIENVPGWWSSIARMKPMFESIIQDLKTRCPQLEIRQHWITRLAYGRDLQYLPYINNTLYTNSSIMKYIYFYPGLMKLSGGADYIYYDADKIRGRINVDDSIKNDDVYGYAMCDMYNHAVRYPEEEKLYNEAVKLAKDNGKTPPEYSLRMLLEKMNSESEKFKNIILINLHGELIPFPPMRNYSDAAKDPQNEDNKRVVTHPEKLRYSAGEDVNLRVYSYVTNPDSWSQNADVDWISILIKDTHINSSRIDIDKIVGNRNSNYGKDPANQFVDYFHSYSGSDTLIRLRNSPLRHEERDTFIPGQQKKGLNPAYRLYGMEYIPCPVDNNNFNTDLDSQTNVKNTARWIIKIKGLPSNYYTIETRIGDNLNTGTLTNKPSNLSRTYVWIGVTPPVTEQYQFIGDPRHCPYLDTKQSHYYNWYYIQIPITGDYKNFDQTISGWGNDRHEIDVPRFFQMYRQGLLNTTAIWTTLNGFSFYYYGFGGEFGSDQDPLPSAIPFLKQPWTNVNSEDTKSVYVDEILPYTHGVGPVLINSRIVAERDNPITSNTWYAKYWLGELYPDSEYNLWKQKGNLRTGNNNFFRTLHSDFSVFDRNRESVRLASIACASFVNGSPLGTDEYFRHEFFGGIGNATSLGQTLPVIFNTPILQTIGASRPFTIHFSGSKPPEWNDTEYKNQRTITSIPVISGKPRVYYDSNYIGSLIDVNSSGLVKLNNNTYNKSCYLIFSGLNIQANFGPGPLGKYSITTLLRTFLDAGQFTGYEKIPQIPLLDLTNPNTYDEFNNPDTINIQWNTQWKRWDGNNYTAEYPDDYSESTPLVYAIKYSNDNGKTWYYCDDNSITFAGRKEILKTLPISFSSYPWDVSDASKFPKGSYIIRVECFRKDIDLHYGYDQIQIYINR